MKHRITLLIGVLLISSSVYGQIRNTTWGDNVEEVKAAITEEIVQDQKNGRKHIILTSTTVGSKDAAIGYVFGDDKLIRINYIFREVHSNDNNHIDDFNDIDEILEQKYGEPDSEDRVWSNDLYRDEPSEYGFAISLGHYGLQTKWNTEDTDITHVLTGNNYDIEHMLQYSSVELGSLEDRINEEKNVSDF